MDVAHAKLDSTAPQPVRQGLLHTGTNRFKACRQETQRNRKQKTEQQGDITYMTLALARQ